MSRISRQAKEQIGEFNIPGLMTTPSNAALKREWRPSTPEEIEAFKRAAEESTLGWGMEEEEEPQLPKRSLGISMGRYAVWSVSRKRTSELLLQWASNTPSSEFKAEGGGPADKVKASLEKLAQQEIPKGLAIWGLAEPSSTPTGGGGFYLIPPCDPQAIIIVEAIDGERVVFLDVASNPAAVTSGLQTAIQDWMESLEPKKLILQNVDQWMLFALQPKVGGGYTRVSRGL